MFVISKSTKGPNLSVICSRVIEDGNSLFDPAHYKRIFINYKIGDTIKVAGYTGIIKAIGNAPGKTYDDNPCRIWSNWDRTANCDDPDNWTYINIFNKSYVVLKKKQFNLPEWF